MTLVVLFKLWSIHGRRTLDIPETSVLVHDQRGSGVYLTLKLKCYYCDEEDYGPVWANLMKDKSCQDAITSQCYVNQTTSDRKTTQVLRLMRSCTRKCTCADDEGWCKPRACPTSVQCCWGNVYCSDNAREESKVRSRIDHH
ncbi:uncharacterized protein LOC116307545 isoform X2 [Actinia tenebrosa]|nr:uncharacterized protein LOC116307545 isoform X2 [Actinia tenebrosa]